MQVLIRFFRILVLYLCSLRLLHAEMDSKWEVFPFELNSVGSGYYSFYSTVSWSGNVFYVDIQYKGSANENFVWYYEQEKVGARPILDSDPMFSTTTDNKKYMNDRHIIYKQDGSSNVAGNLYFVAYDSDGFAVRVDLNMTKQRSLLRMTPSEYQLSPKPSFKYTNYDNIIFDCMKYSFNYPKGELVQYLITNENIIENVSEYSMESMGSGYTRYLNYTLNDVGSEPEGVLVAKLSYKDFDVPITYKLREVLNAVSVVSNGNFAVRFSPDNTFSFIHNKGGVIVCEAIANVDQPVVLTLMRVKGDKSLEKVNSPTNFVKSKYFTRLEVVIAEPTSDMDGEYICKINVGEESKEEIASFKYYDDVPLTIKFVDERWGERRRFYKMNITATGSPLPTIQCFMVKYYNWEAIDFSKIPNADFIPRDLLVADYSLVEETDEQAVKYVLVISKKKKRDMRRKKVFVCVAENKFGSVFARII